MSCIYDHTLKLSILAVIGHQADDYSGLAPVIPKMAWVSLEVKRLAAILESYIFTELTLLIRAIKDKPPSLINSSKRGLACTSKHKLLTFLESAILRVCTIIMHGI